MKPEITHGEKIMYPGPGYSKKDIYDYYDRVAEYMLPHLKDRALMMQRFPDGINGKGFYQKNVSDYFPDWIDRVELAKEDGTVIHVLCNDKRTLLYLVNQNTLSFHTWLSRSENPDHPDKLIIDLDPADDTFSRVKKAALILHEYLESAGIHSFPMLTGSKGIHIIIPLDAKEEFDTSREAGRILGRQMVHTHPDIFTLETLKKDREGKLYFDIQRNAWAQTAITPFSLRPRKDAPVAVPVEWAELKSGITRAGKYNISNLFRRLAAKKEVWESFGKKKFNALKLKKIFSKESV